MGVYTFSFFGYMWSPQLAILHCWLLIHRFVRFLFYRPLFCLLRKTIQRERGKGEGKIKKEKEKRKTRERDKIVSVRLFNHNWHSHSQLFYLFIIISFLSLYLPLCHLFCFFFIQIKNSVFIEKIEKKSRSFEVNRSYRVIWWIYRSNGVKPLHVLLCFI